MAVFSLYLRQNPYPKFRYIHYASLGYRQQQNPSAGSGTGVNYTLDLAAGLTQVLSDGTNTYLYGNGRISQHATQTEYFLGDALGSVRQLTSAVGTVTLTQSYAPYGDTISSVGSGESAYQFTGEMRDANGLTYLRARYYNSSDGRFISRDTWNGDYNRPLSLNRWNYVEGNPVNLVDPSGHHPCVNPDGGVDIECLDDYIKSSRGECSESGPTSCWWREEVKERFGITLLDEGNGKFGAHLHERKEWSCINAKLVFDSLLKIESVVNGSIKNIIGGGIWTMKELHSGGRYDSETKGTDVEYQTIGQEAIRQMNIYHEFGHVLDNAPGHVDFFSDALVKRDRYLFENLGITLSVDGKHEVVDVNAFIAQDVYDPYHGTAQAKQGYLLTRFEVWADIFANYVAGNIDRSASNLLGREMYDFAFSHAFSMELVR